VSVRRTGQYLPRKKSSGLTEVGAADVVDERVSAAADEDKRLRDDVRNDMPRRHFTHLLQCHANRQPVLTAPSLCADVLQSTLRQSSVSAATG